MEVGNSPGDLLTVLTAIIHLIQISSLVFIIKFMDKVAMEARIRTIYVLTICYLPYTVPNS